jgi:hypothetical protein
MCCRVLWGIYNLDSVSGRRVEWDHCVQPDYTTSDPRHTILLSFSQCSGSMTFFGVDPRILLFSSLTFKMPTKNKFKKKFFCLLLFEGTFTSFFKDKSKKEVTKQ